MKTWRTSCSCNSKMSWDSKEGRIEALAIASMARVSNGFVVLARWRLLAPSRWTVGEIGRCAWAQSGQEQIVQVKTVGIMRERLTIDMFQWLNNTAAVGKSINPRSITSRYWRFGVGEASCRNEVGTAGRGRCGRVRAGVVGGGLGCIKSYEDAGTWT